MKSDNKNEMRDIKWTTIGILGLFFILMLGFMFFIPDENLKDELSNSDNTTELFSYPPTSDLDDSTNILKNMFISEIIEFKSGLISSSALALQGDFHEYYQDTVVVNNEKIIYLYSTITDEFYAVISLTNIDESFKLWGNSEGEFSFEQNGEKMRTSPIQSDIDLVEKVRDNIGRRIKK